MATTSITTVDVGAGPPAPAPDSPDRQDRTEGPPPEAATDADPGGELLEGQRWTTVAQLGDVLPLATGADRSFSFRPGSLRSALETSRQQPDECRTRPYLQLAYQLGGRLAALQGVRHASVEEAAFAVQRLPLYSVLYMLLRLAVHHGRKSAMRVRCPARGCQEVQDAKSDLGAIRVRAWGALGDLPQVAITLGTSLEWPAGKRTAELTLEPAPFGALCELSAGAANDPTEITAATIFRSVVGTDSVQGRVNVPAAALERLTDQDMADLDAEHDLLSGGPVMVVQYRCCRCGTLMWAPLEWGHISFFEAPSDEGTRSRRRRIR